MVITGAKSED